MFALLPERQDLISNGGSFVEELIRKLLHPGNTNRERILDLPSMSSFSVFLFGDPEHTAKQTGTAILAAVEPAA